MAYTKHTWVVGEVITKALQDHLETQYDEAVTDIATHAALDTGVHGAGGDVLATDADIATHSALATGVHGAGGNTLAIATYGSYAGNAAVNRAIPHGLGKAVQFVFIAESTFGPMFFEIIGRAIIHYENGAASNNLAVTTPDATNFYVGNAADYGQSANDGAGTYYWVAIG